MKKLVIIALATTQVAAGGPQAMAAELGEERRVVSHRQGAFAGARLRIPLDGTRARQPQAGLTLAPVLQGRLANGSVRTRFGEGLELRLAGAAKPELAVGGRSFAQLAEGRAGPEGQKVGISTIGWVAIGIGVAAAVVFALGQLCADGEICGSDRDD